MITTKEVEKLVTEKWRTFDTQTPLFYEIVDFALEMYNRGHEDNPHTRGALDLTSPAKKVVWQQSQHPMNNLEEAAFLAIAKTFGDLLVEKQAEFTRRTANRSADEMSLTEVAEQQEKVIETLMDYIEEAYQLLKTIKIMDDQWHTSEKVWMSRAESLLFGGDE